MLLCTQVTVFGPALFSMYIKPLRKKDGGIRPEPIGKEIRRLAAKAGCYAARKFITNKFVSVDSKIIVKLDMMNAFNSVRHDHVLQTCLDRTPEIAELSFLAYGKPSSVIAAGHSITLSTGVQQGEPIDSLLFALAVDQIASGVESELNVWHLDDAAIGGTPG